MHTRAIRRGTSGVVHTRRLAMGGGGILFTGVVLCLLVTSAYGGGAPVVTAALNNSVVSAELAVPTVATLPAVTPCPTCNLSSVDTEPEILSPTKDAETSGDALVRTNHIDLTRYAAGSPAEEVLPEQVFSPEEAQSDKSTRAKPHSTSRAYEDSVRRLSEAANRSYESREKSSTVEDSLRRLSEAANRSYESREKSSTVEDSLRRLSEAANRSYENRQRELSSVQAQSMQPTPSILTRQDVSESKSTEEKLSTTGQTPELPTHAHTLEKSFITTVQYDIGAEPSKFIRSSTVVSEDGTTSGFVSTRAFSYSESITPSIAPMSVQFVTSTSSSFDIQLSGSSTSQHDDRNSSSESPQPATVSPTTNDTATSASNLETRSTSTTRPEPVANLTVATSSSEELMNTERDARIDIQLSGSSTSQHDDRNSSSESPQPATVSPTTNDTATSASNLETRSTSTMRPEPVANLTVATSSSEDMFGMNSTEISSKLMNTERDARIENESTNKDVTTERSSSTHGSKDLVGAMARQPQTTSTTATITSTTTGVFTVGGEPTTSRSRFRPTVNIPRIVSLWRGSSRYAGTAISMPNSTPENVFLESALPTAEDMLSSSSAPVATTVGGIFTSTETSLMTPGIKEDIVTSPRTVVAIPVTTLQDIFSPTATSDIASPPNNFSATPSDIISNATVTTMRTETSSSESVVTTQRIATSTAPEITTYRGTTTTQATLPSTVRPVTPDTQGEESSIECTTLDNTVAPETTPQPEEETTTMVHRTSTYRTRTTTRNRTRPPHRTSTTTPTSDISQEDYNESTTPLMSTTRGQRPYETSSEQQTESSSRRTSAVPPTQHSATPAETEAPPTDESRPSCPPFTSFLHVTVATTWEEMCRGQEEFRQGMAALLTRGLNREVSAERVVIVNSDECLEPPPTSPAGVTLQIYLVDERGGYDQSLTEAFPRIWTADHANKLKITRVDVRERKDESPSTATAAHGNVVAVIAIAAVALACLLLLLILMLVMRKRQKRYNYGQRCTPVSLDAYSLDSVSVYNSVRRKGHLRASKRSYGNPAFDDPESPTRPVNFAGLANCAGDTKALHEEFALVPVVTARMEELPPGAESKNRYANVIPLPETRVPLLKRGTDPLSEYINANFVRGPKNAPKYYVACQAPLESTVCDFWRMVWEHQCKVVLMLTDLEENGVEKCADYLPPSEVLDCHRRFGDYHVTLKKREVRDSYAVSTLQLKNMETNLWREVTHLWFIGWPSTGVPEEPSALIAFLLEARAFMKSNSGPTVVHCSPGTGRAGTVIACDLCIREFEQSRLVDVPRVVHRLRRDRAGAVQTREQYVFIYQVLNVYATKLTGGAMDSF